VGEGGRDDAGHVLFNDPVLARARVEHLALRVGDHVLDSMFVTLVDDRPRLLIGERPDDRY
jgi:hypothetical protein